MLWLAAAGVFVVEGSFVLCLFSARWRGVVVPAAVGMHLVILRTMGIAFANVAQLALFVDWGAIADRVAVRRRLSKRRLLT